MGPLGDRNGRILIWSNTTAILYASIESVAFEYSQLRGWGPVVSQLPFLALLLGCLVAAAANIYNNIYYGKKLAANHFRPVPEARLPPMMYGGFAFSAGLFLFGCELKLVQGGNSRE